MGEGFHVGGIELVDLFDILEDIGQLLGVLGHFLVGHFQAGQFGDILDVFFG